MHPRSLCRSVSRFACLSQFVWQPWKDTIQTTRTPQEVASGLCTTFDADIPDGERFVVNRVKVRRNQPGSSKIGLKVRRDGPQLSISVRSAMTLRVREKHENRAIHA